MKQFTTIKTGYTAGIYGCSGEYFTTIILNGSRHATIRFYGMYGAEERVARALSEKGYKEFYTPANYGKMVRDDTKGSISEYEALQEVKKLTFNK